jgi:hypothetical protein
MVIYETGQRQSSEGGEWPDGDALERSGAD